VNINAAALGGCYGPLGVKIVPKDHVSSVVYWFLDQDS
jgi:hypothetical protein